MEEDNAIRWQIRTLADAYTERPPTEYVVDKFFTAGSLNIVYGAPASMKSMLMADMCAAVVSGNDWLPGSMGNGSEGIAVKTAPVLWIDMDNGTRRTDERIEAVARARGLMPEDPFYYVSMPMPPLNVSDLDSLIYLKMIIRDIDAGVVVIDNLGLVTGEIEENSAAMAMVMGYLRQIAEGTNCALVVIHHQRKGGSNGGRAGDALRGHSSIEAAVDLAIHIVREQGNPEVTLRSTKTRGVDVPMVTACFNFEHRSGTNDLSKAWFDGRPILAGNQPVRDAILAILEEEGEMTKGRLADEVHERMGGVVGINKIRNWIEELVEVTGDIIIKTGEFNAKLVALK